MDIKEKIDVACNLPGVYIFKDKEALIIYIGKAAAIRKRLKGHFTKCTTARQKALIEKIADLDYIVTPDESTALLLEAALIKKYNPRYNVALRDDKSYPRLKLTVNEEYPRLFITRKFKNDGAIYFGPYTNAKLLRRALAFIRRAFPLRTCQRFAKRECLNFHIGQCLAPCVDKEKRQDYMKVVEALKLFLDGRREELLGFLSEQMQAYADKKDYEGAARIRDRIKALSLVTSQPAHFEDIEAELKNQASHPSQQIEELRYILNLTKSPSLIEAFDVSNISGKEAVGSMVVFRDGKPDRQQYRKFRIKTVNTIDDYSMMREIISRRYSYVLYAGQPLPDLIIIDGGKGHLAAAKKELRRLKLWNLAAISIAKGPDKIYISEDKEPILLGKFEGALLLLQRIRDEAHRFAIGYHRLLRRKELGISELDNIKGIGPKKKACLLRHFGSLEEIKLMDIEELKKVKFINEKEAKAVYGYFH